MISNTVFLRLLQGMSVNIVYGDMNIRYGGAECFGNGTADESKADKTDF